MVGQLVEIRRCVDAETFEVRWAGTVIARHRQADGDVAEVWADDHRRAAIAEALRGHDNRPRRHLRAVIVDRRAEGAAGAGGGPVFRSASGALMTLPGGVLLALDPQWDTGTAHAFFARNGIKLDRVSELGYLTNGFFVETASGFASLDLANALAGQAGVYLSSPNWWRERTTK